MLATIFAPAFDPASTVEFSDLRFRFDALYGADDERTGLILDCGGETPRLTIADLVALHGNNCDEAPGDPEDLHFISEPDKVYRARIAEFERLDWEREQEAQARELARHNAEVMGYAWPTSWA